MQIAEVKCHLLARNKTHLVLSYRFTININLSEGCPGLQYLYVHCYFYLLCLLISISFNDQVLNLHSHVFISKFISLSLKVSEISVAKNVPFYLSMLGGNSASGETLKRPGPKMT